ncbi:hypothetical protein CI238_11427, partial [Colletotrichum incanum]
LTEHARHASECMRNATCGHQVGGWQVSPRVGQDETGDEEFDLGLKDDVHLQHCCHQHRCLRL